MDSLPPHINVQRLAHEISNAALTVYGNFDDAHEVLR